MVLFDGNPSNLSNPLPRNVGELHARVSHRHFKLVECDPVLGLPLDEKLRAATIDWWIERYGARPTEEERAEWMKLPPEGEPPTKETGEASPDPKQPYETPNAKPDPSIWQETSDRPHSTGGVPQSSKASTRSPTPTRGQRKASDGV